MPLPELAAWLLDNPRFAAGLRRVSIEAAQAELPADATRPTPDPTPIDWGRLLLGASVLAKVNDAEAFGAACHDAALRIAQHCLARNGDDGSQHPDGGAPTEGQRASAANILDSLANIPAISLAIRRRFLPGDLEERLPIVARMEWTRRRLENSVTLADERTLQVNHFQRRLWSVLDADDWISFSAPTSAGKSFIITRWVIDLVRQNPQATVAYLVPTRALIAQVEGELRALVRAAELEQVNISSLPLARSVVPGRANLLVLTQERFHILSTALPDLGVDALIVDEAHKVGDGHRGVLLQQVIEHVGRTAPAAKVVFASPLTSNPAILVADAPAGRRTRAFTSNEVTVAQNLLWVAQVPRHPRQWTVQLCLPSEVVELGTVNLRSTPDGETKRLSYIAHALGERRGGNIVYVNRAADAETVSLQLYDLRGEASESPDPRLAALIDIAQRTIHPDFLLATVLRRGVAFHYGNLPLLIRTEVERLFTEGIINYLVCTSTLIEGVNMSCRTIFVRGPTKGVGRPMGADDFWNLAGRAGRWGKEFQGNIVCVDANSARVWGEDGPPRVRQQYAIKRTADTVVAQADDLVAFVAAGTPRTQAVRRPDLEFVFAYLVSQQLRRGSIRDLPWVSRLDASAVDRVEGAILAATPDLLTPVTIIERNPGISPLAMDALLRRFARPGRDPAGLLPVDPASQDAAEVYRDIFGRIAGELNAALGPAGPRSYALAILVTHWMRGFPVARLITDRIAYEAGRAARGRGRSGRRSAPALPAIIRQVLSDVEQIARFEAPRSLACYVDLLRLHLLSIERQNLIDSLPDDLNVKLELGVSRQTHISLIGLGLSRTSAVMIGEFLTNDELDEADALRWLSEGIWRQASLPTLVMAEIERVLAVHLPAA